MQFKDVFLLFTSYDSLARYISSRSEKYDLIIYIAFLIQISFLPSVPSGFHSPNVDGWTGFSITVIFSLLFYSIFYYKYYYKKTENYIREVVIISVVARLHSFIFLACMGVLQTGIWAYYKLPKAAGISMLYFLSYYILFAVIMMLSKRKTLLLKKHR
ncbi:MAG: hypothetical protein CME71_00620 [Halobacteriovorax sp.]|nr:hypothetical protein [Halobacteriovorax sp.]|tara:strand:- start:852 stop:1325 length:474 start_codon:yes stop_codon:yes gene_type:complete